MLTWWQLPLQRLHALISFMLLSTLKFSAKFKKLLNLSSLALPNNEIEQKPFLKRFCGYRYVFPNGTNMIFYLGLKFLFLFNRSKCYAKNC